MSWTSGGAPPASPAWYPTLVHKRRSGLYYAGQSIGVTLNTTGASSYVVKDAISGATVASGSITTTDVTVGTAGTVPFDKYGTWHVELTGPNNDVSAALFATSYGGFFCSFIPADARFPTNPAASVGNVGMGDFVNGDLITRGVLGIGPERIPIDAANDPTTGSGNSVAYITTAQNVLAVEKPYYTQFTPDTARPRYSFVAFPNGANDRLALDGGSTAFAYPADPATYNGNNLYVQIDPGTSSGFKFTVRYPDTATVVETYDNLATYAALTTAAAASPRVVIFAHTPSNVPPTMAATAIGGTYYSGVGVAVSALYPDVTYFEGPRNEASFAGGTELAHMQKMFYRAVKAGNPSAKVLGPCLVDFLSAGKLPTLTAAFAAGLASWIDLPSTHGYNAAGLGDIPLARSTLTALHNLLVANGFTSWWQTEMEINTSNYGALHTRRGVNWQFIMTLMNEQFGCPKEQTHFWYNLSHGFWSAPGFWQTVDLSVYPNAIAYRAFSAELFGKTYTSALSFGQPGDDYLLGSVYTDGSTGDKVIALIGAGVGAGIPVAFTVVGAGSLTVLDWASNVSTVTATDAKATVTVTDTPVYVRVPSGVTVTLVGYSTQPTTATPTNLALTATVTTTGVATGLSAVNDGVATNGYSGSTAPYTDTNGVLPGQVTLTWATPQVVDHVVVKCPPPWQALSSFTDFDVQSSVDGTTWVTQQTTTKDVSSALVYEHAESSNSTGTLITSYWDEQHIFDVKFASPVTAKAVRVNVRATSYGGEPTVDAVTQGVGQRSATQQIVIADIHVSLDAAAPTVPAVHLARHGAFS